MTFAFTELRRVFDTASCAAPESAHSVWSEPRLGSLSVRFSLRTAARSAKSYQRDCGQIQCPCLPLRGPRSLRTVSTFQGKIRSLLEANAN